MENIDNDISIQPSIEETEYKDVPKKTSPISKLNVVIVALISIILILIAFLVYAFFTDRLDIGIKNPFSQNIEGNNTVDDTDLVSEEESNDTDSTSDEENIEDEDNEVDIIAPTEYRNEKVGISLYYNQDWKITKDQTVYDGVGYDLQLEITNIANPKWVFVYDYPSGSGPAVCRYADSTQDFSEVLEIADYSNYTIIPESDGILRRSLSSNKSGYSICRKGDSSESFVTWINPGYVSYKVDSNDSADDYKTRLSDLDQILLSLEKISK